MAHTIQLFSRKTPSHANEHLDDVLKLCSIKKAVISYCVKFDVNVNKTDNNVFF
jgi:hypothetical protein